jgi:hypothetical protein
VREAWRKAVVSSSLQRYLAGPMWCWVASLQPAKACASPITKKGASSCARPLLPDVERRSCNLLRLDPPDLPEPVSSNQVALRRPEVTTYRCFLPDLTGFVGFCRAGPGLQRHFSLAVSKRSEPQEGFRPRYSGFRGYRAPLAPRLARPPLS